MSRRVFLAMLAFAAIISLSAQAQEAALVFDATGVNAPVRQFGMSVWIVTTGTSTTVTTGSDNDGDGWVRYTPAVDPSASVWVIDVYARRFMGGTSAGPLPSSSGFPPGLFVLDWGYSQLVYRRPETCRFILVKPTGVYQLVPPQDGDPADRDGLANGYTVIPIADFVPLAPGAAPPEKVERGDFFLGIESASSWFGGKVDDQLDTSVGAGVIGVPELDGVSEAAGSTYDLFVMRRGGTEGTVSVKWATQDDTAKAGVDYDAASGTLVYGPGEYLKTVKVNIRKDTLYGGDRRLFVRFFEPAGTTILRTATEIRINDDETAPVAYVADVVIPEGNAPVGTAALDVVLQVVSARRVSAIVEWRAEAPGLPPQEGTLTFAPNETRKTINVPYKGDARPSDDQSIAFQFTKLTNCHGSRGVQSIPIAEDDFAEVEIGDVTIDENGGGVQVPIRATIAGRRIDGRWTVTGGNAEAGTDYPVRSGYFTIWGELTVVDVWINDDATPEPDEWLTVVLSEVSGANVTKSTAVVTIVDDDSSTRTPTITVDDWAGAESDTARFTLHLSSPAPQDVRVTATVRGKTAEASRDVVDGSREIVIPAGRTTATFDVSLVNDSEREQREQFEVELSNASNATIARALATARIDDDDDPSLPRVTIDAFAASERSFTRAALRLSEPQPLPVMVTYATEDVTATAGVDYGAEKLQVVFEPGMTEVPLAIAHGDDALPEPTETFRIRLLAANGATIGTPSVTCTIIDDDNVPSSSKRRAMRP